MNNQAMLKQIRDGIIREIQTNPSFLQYVTFPIIKNSEGEDIFDFDAAEIVVPIIARIALNQKGVLNDIDSSVANSTNFSRLIKTDYNTIILQGARIRGLEREYVIGEVTPLMKFGGIYGYQASLTEGD